jgi:cytochrome P450
VATHVPTADRDPAILDVTAPGFAPDSEEVAAARERHWWARTPIGPLVLRHEQARDLLADRRFGRGSEQHMASMGITEGPTYDWWTTGLLNSEGTDHTRLRGLVQKAFLPRRTEQLRPSARRTADGLAAAIDPGGCEFAAAFAEPLPALVMCELLGVPPEDYDRFHARANDIGLAFARAITPEQLPAVDAAITALSGYIAELIAARRAAPGDDLISGLIAAEEAGDRLTPAELHNLVMILVWAGQDTTARQLCRALVTFAEHPDQWRLVAARPELASRAADEACRWQPQTLLWRCALEDVAYDDLEVAAGSMVFMALVAGNRDPRAFAGDPGRFDVTVRNEAANLQFGAGIHHCLGSRLALMEVTEAFGALTAQLGPPELAGEPVWRPPNAAIGGPDVLPLRFAAR